MAKWTQASQSIGAGGANINWASIDTTFDAGDHFDLTASADIEVNDFGLYALIFQIIDVNPPAGKSSKLFVTADVTSGSAGLWSSQVSGAEYSGIMPIQIVDGNANDISVIGAGQICAYVGWTPANTFPVKIETFVQWTEDNIGVTKTIGATATMVRFGDGDV